MCTIEGHTRIILAASTTPHNAITGCSHMCQPISQALYWAIGTTQPALQRDLYCTTVHYTEEPYYQEIIVSQVNPCRTAISLMAANFGNNIRSVDYICLQIYRTTAEQGKASRVTISHRLKSAKTPSMMAISGVSFVLASESALITLSEDAATETLVSPSSGDRYRAKRGSVVVSCAGRTRTAYIGTGARTGGRKRATYIAMVGWGVLRRVVSCCAGQGGVGLGV